MRPLAAAFLDLKGRSGYNDKKDAKEGKNEHENLHKDP